MNVINVNLIKLAETYDFFSSPVQALLGDFKGIQSCEN